MKKNILIIGYGDLGKRLTNILDSNLYNFSHVSRNNKYDSDDFIKWDWLSEKEFEHNFEKIDVVIFFPKPAKNDQSGYEDGFKNSAENLYKIIAKTSIDKFISISSTRVYNKESESLCREIDSIHPTDFRGKLIKQNEEKQFLSQQAMRLQDWMPEFADPQKRSLFIQDMTKKAEKHYQLTPEQMATVKTADEVMILTDALKYRELMANKSNATKKAKDARPTVVTPSARKSNNAGKASRAKKSKANMQKTGSIDDVAKYIGNL